MPDGEIKYTISGTADTKPIDRTTAAVKAIAPAAQQAAASTGRFDAAIKNAKASVEKLSAVSPELAGIARLALNPIMAGIMLATTAFTNAKEHIQRMTAGLVLFASVVKDKFSNRMLVADSWAEASREYQKYQRELAKAQRRPDDPQGNLDREIERLKAVGETRKAMLSLRQGPAAKSFAGQAQQSAARFTGNLDIDLQTEAAIKKAKSDAAKKDVITAEDRRRTADRASIDQRETSAELALAEKQKAEAEATLKTNEDTKKSKTAEAADLYKEGGTWGQRVRRTVMIGEVGLTYKDREYQQADATAKRAAGFVAQNRAEVVQATEKVNRLKALQAEQGAVSGDAQQLAIAATARVTANTEAASQAAEMQKATAANTAAIADLTAELQRNNIIKITKR